MTHSQERTYSILSIAAVGLALIALAVASSQASLRKPLMRSAQAASVAVTEA